ncbi:MAG: hypothetical protein ACE37F_30915 [Nannocystaceae bacterium]|nr:hypothetical protein [bacterium]
MKPYANPEAFKQALEARIRKAAPTNIGRFRQVLVFDRFLGRVHQQFGNRVMVSVLGCERNQSGGRGYTASEDRGRVAHPVTSARLALIADTAAALGQREQARVEAPRALRDAQDAAQNESAATSNITRPMRDERRGRASNCGLPAPLG